MKPQSILYQFVQSQIQLLPNNYKQQYSNLMQLLKDQSEYKTQWLLFVYNTLEQYFCYKKTPILPPYNQNNKLLQPPRVDLNLQQVNYDLKNVQLNLKDIYVKLGKRLSIQMATLILGKETQFNLEMTKELQQTDKIQTQNDNLEDLQTIIKQNEQFIQEQYKDNQSLNQQVIQLTNDLKKISKKYNDLTHIEQLYVQQHKKLTKLSPLPNKKSTIHLTSTLERSAQNTSKLDTNSEMVQFLEKEVEQANLQIKNLALELERKNDFILTQSEQISDCRNQIALFEQKTYQFLDKSPSKLANSVQSVLHFSTNSNENLTQNIEFPEGFDMKIDEVVEYE